MQAGDLDPGRDAQRRIEVGQRLVKQEHVGLAHDRAADRHALPLAAREVARVAAEQLLEAQHSRCLGDPPVALRLGDAGELEAEGHVLAHVHMRVEGIGLEHHRDFPLGGRERIDEFAADENVPRGRRVEPGDHPQKRGLAATRGADQNDKFSVLDRKADLAQHVRRPIALVEMVDAQIRHAESCPI